MDQSVILPLKKKKISTYKNIKKCVQNIDLGPNKRIEEERNKRICGKHQGFSGIYINNILGNKQF